MTTRRLLKQGEKSRVAFLAIAFFLFGVLLVLRLASMQLANASFYRQLVAEKYSLAKKLIPQRGEVTVRDQTARDERYLVAANTEEYLLLASPHDLQDIPAAAQLLAPYLGKGAAELEEVLRTPKRSRIVLAERLPEDQVSLVNALRIPGITIPKEVMRSYAQGEFLGPVLGFLGYEGERRVGQYGIEGFWDSELRGKGGALELGSSWANLVPISRAKAEVVAAVDGDDLELTIDYPIQFAGCSSLAQAVERHGASSGSLVVMDPKTGAILAMCSVPGFDSNQYGQVSNPTAYHNAAIYSAYEPGSVFKAITMAAALELGKVTPDTTYHDEGSVTIGSHVIKNSDGKAHGTKTMTEVLEESLNTGAIEAARRVGNKTFAEFVRAFGFGERTGIELDTEVAGDISLVLRERDIYTATTSYGQGLTATPLQLASAYAAIANGGVRMKPMIVSRIRHPDGTVEEIEPKEIRRVISRRTATLLSAMLTSVVERGHGKRAGVAGYYVAGKTGTAQVAKKGEAGYDPDTSIGTFIGFAPVEDPRFVALVRIDNPQDVKFAESTAAPVFAEVAKFLLSYLEVPPTRK